MSAIYEEVTLSWRDKEITVRPTFRLVQQIEARGISLFGVYKSLREGEPRITQVAEIISELLKSGGAVAPVDEVYARIVHSSPEEWERIAFAISAVFMPAAKPGN